MARRQLVLILDGDRETLDVALAAVDFSPAVDIVLTHDTTQARARLAGRVPDLTLLDVDTARAEGPEAIASLLPAGEPILLLTQVESLEHLSGGLLGRSADVLAKPLRIAEARFRMKRLLAHGAGNPPDVAPLDVALGQPAAGRAPTPHEGAAREIDPGFVGASEWTVLLGDSEPIRELRRQIELVAAADDCVLLQGEPGTRREVVARAIHARGGRGSRRFLTVGARRLAATAPRAGAGEGSGEGGWALAPSAASRALDPRDLVREAAGGTLFVPDLADLDVAGQRGLLAVIEEIERAAAGRARPPAGYLGLPETAGAARLVASTTTSLARLVQAGSFSRALFYRLLTHTVQVPALRERGRDVLLLARHVASRAAAAAGRGEPTMSPAAEAGLLAHHWPGNVRELEACIARAVRGSGDVIDREHLELAAAAGPLLPFRDAKRDVVDRFERAYAARALALANGNISAAARLAGKDRKDFWAILRKHGIAIARRRQAPEDGGNSPTRNLLGQDTADPRAEADSCREITSLEVADGPAPYPSIARTDPRN